MSTLRANTISDAAGTGPVALTGQWASKAHCAFTNAGTPTLDGMEQNVSSLTDHGVGQTGINFTNSFSAATYSFTVANIHTDTRATCMLDNDRTPRATGSSDMMTGAAGSNVMQDRDASASYFGDLA